MELGSEYNLKLNQLNIKNDNLFKYLEDYNYELFDSGRSALKAIPYDAEGFILMPEFICESVINCFSHEKIRFYKITEDMQIDFEDLKKKLTPDIKTIFVMHYFGTVQDSGVLKKIRDIADENSILIIEDTTQSLFSSRLTIGDYAVASIRKWMPLPNGGILYSQNKNVSSLTEGLTKNCDNDRSYGMILKDLFLDDILDCNSEYRGIFSSCEQKLDDSQIPHLISDFSSFIIECMDVEDIIMKRKRNYSFLKEKLKTLGMVPVCEIFESQCPFVFPLRVLNRDAFRKYLQENKVYCAVHWPFDNICPDERRMGKRNSETLISLPIDQRYGIHEMEYLFDVISKYGGTLSF